MRQVLLRCELGCAVSDADCLAAHVRVGGIGTCDEDAFTEDTLQYETQDLERVLPGSLEQRLDRVRDGVGAAGAGPAGEVEEVDLPVVALGALELRPHILQPRPPNLAQLDRCDMADLAGLKPHYPQCEVIKLKSVVAEKHQVEVLPLAELAGAFALERPNGVDNGKVGLQDCVKRGNSPIKACSMKPHLVRISQDALLVLEAEGCPGQDVRLHLGHVDVCALVEEFRQQKLAELPFLRDALGFLEVDKLGSVSCGDLDKSGSSEGLVSVNTDNAAFRYDAAVTSKVLQQGLEHRRMNCRTDPGRVVADDVRLDQYALGARIELARLKPRLDRRPDFAVARASDKQHLRLLRQRDGIARCPDITIARYDIERTGGHIARQVVRRLSLCDRCTPSVTAASKFTSLKRKSHLEP